MRDTPSTTAPSRGTGAGFSLLELIVTIGILAIVAAIVVPVFHMYQTYASIRAEAKALDTTFTKARMMAAITQKPIRVVVNCRKLNAPSCVLNLQTPTYGAGVDVAGWRSDPTYRHVFSDKVWSQYRGSSHDSDADPGLDFPAFPVYWAVFMPDSRVFSNPRPFSLFVHDIKVTEGTTSGWMVSLGSDSGRVLTQRADVDLTT